MLAAAAAYVMKNGPAQVEARQQAPAAGPAAGVSPPAALVAARPARTVISGPAKPRRTAGELATLAADAAIRPFGAALSAGNRLKLHLAVRQEVLKAIRS